MRNLQHNVPLRLRCSHDSFQSQNYCTGPVHSPFICTFLSLASTIHGSSDDGKLHLQVTVKDEIPEDAFVLDEAEVDAVKYVDVATLEEMYRSGDKTLVPANLDGEVCPIYMHFSLMIDRGSRCPCHQDHGVVGLRSFACSVCSLSQS